LSIISAQFGGLRKGNGNAIPPPATTVSCGLEIALIAAEALRRDKLKARN